MYTMDAVVDLGRGHLPLFDVTFRSTRLAYMHYLFYKKTPRHSCCHNLIVSTHEVVVVVLEVYIAMVIQVNLFSAIILYL